jgi:hypothetical protein
MSLLLNIMNARKRWTDSAKTDSYAADSPAADSRPADSHPADPSEADSHDNVFNLIPPETDNAETPPATPLGRNVHPVEMTDLSRLAIDNDGRLYWDGKPVEVHRRLLMSREQVIGACVIGAFVIVGALGAVLQGTSAARDWACRFGWATSVCGPPSVPRNTFDIPA